MPKRESEVHKIKKMCKNCLKSQSKLYSRHVIAFSISAYLSTLIYCSKRMSQSIHHVSQLRIQGTAILLIYHKDTIQGSFNTRSTPRYSNLISQSDQLSVFFKNSKELGLLHQWFSILASGVGEAF